MKSFFRKLLEEKESFEKIRKENNRSFCWKFSLERLKECLSEIAEIIEKLPELEEMKALLEKAGCRRSLNDIGLSDK